MRLVNRGEGNKKQQKTKIGYLTKKRDIYMFPHTLVDYYVIF